MALLQFDTGQKDTKLYMLLLLRFLQGPKKRDSLRGFFALFSRTLTKTCKLRVHVYTSCLLVVFIGLMNFFLPHDALQVGYKLRPL